MKLRTGLWIVVVLGALVAQGTRAQDARVTLAQVVHAARQDPPRVLAALAAAQQAEAEHFQARGARLPFLTLQVNGATGYEKRPLTEDVRYDQITASYGGSATTELAIFDMVRRRRIQAAEGRVISADADLADTRRRAVSAAVALYVRALATEEFVDNAEKTAQRRAKQHEAISGLVRAGLRPGVDEVRTRVEAVSARYAFQRQTILRQQAHAALAQAMGRDPAQGVVPAPVAEVARQVPTEIHAATAFALANRPDLRSLEARVRTRRDELGAMRMRRLPTLGLRATGSANHVEVLKHSKNVATLAGTSYAASGMLYLQWDGFDATVIRGAGPAKSALHQAQRLLEQTILEVRGEVTDSVYALRVAQREAERAEEVLAGAQQTLEAQTHRYEVGAASLLDLLDAESLAQNAQLDAIESARDLTLARIELLATCGLLWDSLP